ncbi:MAG TPA: LuxR C-terminal-related transcriptional regulator, partial [Actinoplanes sp.]|nr:LuxR C-terminal-related transcriptional regulator [Actinoplanes sp.]
RTPTAIAYAAAARATIAQARGDADALLAAADELERANTAGEPGAVLLAAARADALSRLGDVTGAKQALAAFEAGVAMVERRSAQMSMARVRGQIAAAEGRYADALDDCRIALQLAREIGLPLETARVEGLIGEYAAAAGRRAAAERSLRAALRQFAALGADAYVTLTLAAAERAGLSMDAPPAALNLLTPAERAVATEVCRGLSNREVAQRLSLSPKTVEFHLTNVFRRLDVATRAELREVATDLV